MQISHLHTFLICLSMMMLISDLNIFYYISILTLIYDMHTVFTLILDLHIIFTLIVDLHVYLQLILYLHSVCTLILDL